MTTSAMGEHRLRAMRAQHLGHIHLVRVDMRAVSPLVWRWSRLMRLGVASGAVTAAPAPALTITIRTDHVEVRRRCQVWTFRTKTVVVSFQRQ